MAPRRLGCPLGWLRVSLVPQKLPGLPWHDPTCSPRDTICGPGFFHLTSPRESCRNLTLGQLALKFLSHNEHFGHFLGPIAGKPVVIYSSRGARHPG